MTRYDSLATPRRTTTNDSLTLAQNLRRTALAPMWSKRAMSLVRAALLLLAVVWPAAGAVGTAASQGQGIVVMAHGGTPQWNAAVLEAVQPIRRFCPVEVAFGMADRGSLQQAVSRLASQGVGQIAVVRLFVSGESFLEQTEYFLGLRPAPPPYFLLHEGPGGEHGAHGDNGDASSAPPRFVDSRTHPLPPIDSDARLCVNRDGLYDSPAMGRVIEERVQDLSRKPAHEAVLVLAHGEGAEAVNDRWLQRLDHLAEHIRVAGYAAVRVATLREDWHDKRRLAEARIREFVQSQQNAGRDVIVVPFRVFGFGPYRQVLKGLEYVADGRGLLPHPAVTQWIREQASHCFDRAGFPNPLSAPAPEADNESGVNRWEK